MTTQQLTLCISDRLNEQLSELSREWGVTPEAAAALLLEEGVRMAEHPGVVFRPGASGRRPGLANGPDIWEVARLFLGAEAVDDDLIKQSARLIDLHPRQIRIAMGYYVAYRDEIDAWIADLDAESERAMAEWLETQAAVHS